MAKTVFTLFSAGILALASLAPAQAVGPSDTDIVIDAGYVAPTKIAIADFVYKGARLNVPIEQIIGQDLTYSGAFDYINPKNFPQNIATESIKPELWADADIKYLVTGEVISAPLAGLELTKDKFASKTAVQEAANANGLVLEYKLYDLTGVLCPVGQVCKTNRIAVPMSDQRRLAHTAANEIFETFTKIPGDFTSKLAFVQQPVVGLQNYNLVIADYDGYNPKVIYSSKKPITSPDWSYDGRKIAFSTFGTFNQKILSYDLATGKVSTLVNDQGNNGAPAWSPNGRYLAYAKGNLAKFDVVVKDLQTGSVRNLTNGRGKSTEPTWYGDNLVIYTSDREGGRPAIYQTRLDGSSNYRVSKTTGSSSNGKVAAKYALLAMINNDRLTTQDLKTGRTAAISTTLLDENLSISPNGNLIVYSSAAGNAKILNLISSDGRFRARLPYLKGSLSYPAWSK